MFYKIMDCMETDVVDVQKEYVDIGLETMLLYGSGLSILEPSLSILARAMFQKSHHDEITYASPYP